jgi:hypothetical protein
MLAHLDLIFVVRPIITSPIAHRLEKLIPHDGQGANCIILYGDSFYYTSIMEQMKKLSLIVREEYAP